MTVTTTITAQDLLTNHTELVAARAAAVTDNAGAGKLASISRKIRATEYMIEMHQITSGDTLEYEPWNPPSTATESLVDLTEEQLRSMLETAKQTRLDAQTSGKKASAMQTYKRVAHELEARGCKVEPFTPPRPGILPALSNDDLLTRIAAIERLLASPRIRPSIAKIANREHEALTNLAADRGLTTAPPADAPTVDAGALLDQVNDQVAEQVNVPEKRSRKAVAA